MTTCSWWEAVSAAIDGELDGDERSKALTHARSCSACSAASKVETTFGEMLPDSHVLTARERRWFGRGRTRWLLLTAGAIIFAISVPAYIGGDGLSPDSHAARHLASWQLSFGVGLFVAATLSRMSSALLALALTFASLTIAARVIDVISGQHGPWLSSVHVVELIGVFLLWRITPPHLLPGLNRDRAAGPHPPAPLHALPTIEEEPGT